MWCWSCKLMAIRVGYEITLEGDWSNTLLTDGIIVASTRRWRMSVCLWARVVCVCVCARVHARVWMSWEAPARLVTGWDLEPPLRCLWKELCCVNSILLYPFYSFPLSLAFVFLLWTYVSHSVWDPHSSLRCLHRKKIVFRCFMPHLLWWEILSSHHSELQCETSTLWGWIWKKYQVRFRGPWRPTYLWM